MKKKNTAEFLINFRLNNQRLKLRKPAIYTRLTIGNQRVKLTAHQHMDIRHWDQIMSRLRKKA